MFFLFLRLALGVFAAVAWRFLPKALVKVTEVAEMPMVVVVVALGGSMGTSGSELGSSSPSESESLSCSWLSGETSFPLASSSSSSSSSSCFLFCSSFFFFLFSFLFSLLAARACFLLSSLDWRANRGLRDQAHP